MSDLKERFDTVFFDADDTLWENERFFREAEAKFAELLAGYTSPEGVWDMLWRKQEDNIPLFGYGSKTYMIGMTDAALELCGGVLPEHNGMPRGAPAPQNGKRIGCHRCDDILSIFYSGS